MWDMLDHLPIGYDIPWAVHACLFAYGVRAGGQRAAGAAGAGCVEEEGRDEFMLIVSPLPVMGGTGSPANPLAMF